MEETPVASEVEDPLGKLDDALPLPLLELGPTGEYGGGAEYWRGRTCFGRFTDQKKSVSNCVYSNAKTVAEDC